MNNCLLNGKLFDWTKLKAFSDREQNFAKVMIERVENIVKERRKCWLSKFSTFPSIFSIACSDSVVNH